MMNGQNIHGNQRGQNSEWETNHPGTCFWDFDHVFGENHWHNGSQISKNAGPGPSPGHPFPKMSPEKITQKIHGKRRIRVSKSKASYYVCIVIELYSITNSITSPFFFPTVPFILAQLDHPKAPRFLGWTCGHHIQNDLRSQRPVGLRAAPRRAGLVFGVLDRSRMFGHENVR